MCFISWVFGLTQLLIPMYLLPLFIINEKYITFFSGFFDTLVMFFFLFFSIRKGSVIVNLTIIGDSRQNVLQLLLDAIRQGQVGSFAVDSNYTFSQSCKFMCNNIEVSKTLLEKKITPLFKNCSLKTSRAHIHKRRILQMSS